MEPDAQQGKVIRVAEMFAGIGGFRLGLCGHEKRTFPVSACRSFGRISGSLPATRRSSSPGGATKNASGTVPA